MRHSLLLGHLPIMGEIARQLPADAYPLIALAALMPHWRRLYATSGPGSIPDADDGATPTETTTTPGGRPPSVVYVDAWPMSAQVLCLTTTAGCAGQWLHERTMPRHEMLVRFFRPLGDGADLITTDGERWRGWRARFSPGFSAKNIAALLPVVLDEVEVFVRVLAGKAGKGVGGWGDVFQFEPLATSLAWDVIGRAALDVKFNEQTNARPGPAMAALLGMYPYLTAGINPANLLSYISPHRQFALWRRRQALDRALKPLLEARVAAMRGADAQPHTIFDHTARRFFGEQQASSTSPPSETTPDSFLRTALANLKLFMFAGHDTTATSMCFAVHLLAQNPRCAARVRAELDAVLGPDLVASWSALRARPHLLNSLVYTAAAVRETLRLYPILGSMRAAAPGLVLSGSVGGCGGGGDDGTQQLFPTEDCVLEDMVHWSHRDPDVWGPRAAEFVPERWLGGRDGEKEDPELRLPTAKGAWRPFAWGPQNCLGQELAMVELKLVLAMTARAVDVECAWEEWDRLNGQTDPSKPKDMVYGDRLYQIVKKGFPDGTPHTKDGMPVHVRLRTAGPFLP